MSIAPTRMIERSKRRHPAAEREACVVEVHENSPPTLFHSGESFRLERLPVGSRIVYPPPPLKGLIDVDAAIAAALDSPLGMDPLDSLLSPGMKLTIAFDDISLPLPPMKTPDIRGRVIEHVLERAYRAGVEDIHLIAALALHRRMTPAELKRAVGARVFDEFYPDRLYNHDAEDPDEIVDLGETRHGEAVELSKRAAESDLLVYVNINLVTMDGGHKSVAVGLGTYNSVKAHHNVHTLRHSRSFMDPSKSELHRSRRPPGRGRRGRGPDLPHRDDAQQRHVRRAAARSWPSPRRAGRRASRRPSPALKRTTDRMSPKLRRAAFHKTAAPYAVTGVTAGAVEPGARGDARALRRPAGGRRARAGRHRDRRAALRRPVQRQLDPEPDPRHVHGARVLLQPLPGRPARARGRRDDLHAPGHARVPPGAPPLLRRLLRGGAERDDRPGRDRAALREGLRRGRVVPPPVPDVATPTTACTRSTCGTGARTRCSTSAT